MKAARKPTHHPKRSPAQTRRPILLLFALAALATGLVSTAKAVTERAPDDIVRYSRFGAVGDGKTDDIDAIVKAHEFANKHDLPVKADDEAT